MEKQHKVFYLGLMKTGTTSMRAALNMLGYTMPSKGKPFFHPDTTANVGDNCVIPRDKYKKIDAMRDDVKFILTVRHNRDIWYRSVMYHYKKFKGDEQRDGVRKAIYGRVKPNGSFMDIYDEHTKEAIRYFTEKYGERVNEKLLIFETGKDGWDELCPFLGEDIPEEDYPIRNEYHGKTE